MSLYDTLKFLHVITVVFMAAPLYNLRVAGLRTRHAADHDRARGCRGGVCLACLPQPRRIRLDVGGDGGTVRLW